MSGLHLLTLAMPAMLMFAASPASAQMSGFGGGPRITLPGPPPNFSWEGRPGFHGGFPGGFFVGDRETVTIIEREIIREVPAEPAVIAPPPPPRKPYAIGATYASLPDGCMKLIDAGVSYFYCGGEWYREVRAGRDPLYRAVARKL
jgi:hypothetical protein